MRSVIVLCLVLMTGVASADTPDPTCCSTAESDPGCILVTPTGQGPSLADRGVVVTVHVRDNLGNPIAGYPFMDIVLGDNAGFSEISICNNGSVADANTDVAGMTTISGQIAAGGWTQNGMQVYLAGNALIGPPLPIDANSPDLTGDLRVDIVDVGQFAIDFLDPAYQFRTDLDCNGREDLGDVGLLAAHNGELCP